jgi:hypothetical protein
VEGISQAVLGSSDQRKLPASLSLFLKSEKSQLCFTEEKEKDLSTGPSVTLTTLQLLLEVLSMLDSLCIAAATLLSPHCVGAHQ